VIRPSLLVLGIIVGIAFGLFYGWQIDPVKYKDTEPSSLRADYKEQYLILIASAYKADGNLDRARIRLATLRDPDPIRTITALAQRMAAEGKDASSPAVLAADLVGGVQPVASVSDTPFSTAAPILPTETFTPPPTALLIPSLTPFPTLTPTATPVYDYALIIREPYCSDVERLPLIIIDVVDANSAPLPGVRVTVAWAEGEDGFVTGLKPEMFREKYRYVFEGEDDWRNLDIPQGERFGYKRLLANADRWRDRSAQELCDRLLDSILAFQGDAHLQDDVTIVAISFFSGS